MHEAPEFAGHWRVRAAAGERTVSCSPSPLFERWDGLSPRVEDGMELAQVLDVLEPDADTAIATSGSRPPAAGDGRDADADGGLEHGALDHGSEVPPGVDVVVLEQSALVATIRVSDDPRRVARENVANTLREETYAALIPE